MKFVSKVFSVFLKEVNWSTKLPGGYWHCLDLVAVAHGLTPFGHRFRIPLLEKKVSIKNKLQFEWMAPKSYAIILVVMLAKVPQFEKREYLIESLLRLKVIRESEVPKPVQGFRLS